MRHTFKNQSLLSSANVFWKIKENFEKDYVISWVNAYLFILFINPI